MDLHEVRVVIDKNGNVELEVNGIKGDGCLDVTRALEAALGGDLDREMTPEAYEPPVETEQRDYLQDG